MPEQEQHVIEVFKFTSCGNWDTDACPHLNKVPMQLPVINAPMYFLLNDKTVKDLNGLCDGCQGLKKKWPASSKYHK